MTKEMVLFRPWDTEFFGTRVGEARMLVLQAASIEIILGEARRKDIRCLYLFCDVDSARELGAQLSEWQAVLPSGKFSLVETRCFYEVEVRSARGRGGSSGLIVRDVQQEDVPVLRRMAWDFADNSRFAKDGHFSLDLCRDYYERSVDREFRENRDRFWVAFDQEKICGFITAQKESSSMGRIVLIAVDPSSRGRGVARGLIATALQWAAQEGLSGMVVQTQSGNTAACALYEKAGFALARQQLIFHGWL